MEIKLWLGETKTKLLLLILGDRYLETVFVCSINARTRELVQRLIIFQRKACSRPKHFFFIWKYVTITNLVLLHPTCFSCVMPCENRVSG